MQDKLLKLFDECINELKSINIDIINNPTIGKIDIKIAPRQTKRYGCCKQENPDTNYYHIIKRGRKQYIHYDRFQEHHIEISRWVMDLNDTIIKNTIIHEMIHCLPNCNNHGLQFKQYATYINKLLGYNISRVGNKELDFKNSNLEFDNKTNRFKYKIICTGCGQIIFRNRLRNNFIKKYRCGKCNSKLEIVK
ncbi:MAG: hypothetical protein HFJ17_04180 [Clostridia bacterium]|nr:hypothetical protein [Clostridia bacterium]